MRRLTLDRTYHSASPVSEAELQSSAGFCAPGCRCVMQMAIDHVKTNRRDAMSLEGVQARGRIRRCSQGEAGSDELNQARRWKGLHLSALRFQSSAGIQAVPVTFKGGP